MRIGRPLALLLLALAATAQADDSMESDRVKSTLRDMDKTSTWYHDDLFGEFAGFRYYAQKRYAEALHYFEIGAYYADKPSQISIGLMYLKGEGVSADAVQALAWMDLAAERGYPAYVAARDRVAATLSAEELSRVAVLREHLASRYGDAAAKPRLANELREGRRQMTGSRAGFDNGVRFLPLDVLAHSGQPGSMDVRTICPQGFWDAQCWEPDQYFAMRDRQLNATVEVGPPQEKQK